MASRLAAEAVIFVRLGVACLGAGWLAAAVATGHRYPGLSLAWLLPFVGGIVAAGGTAGLVALAAQALGAGRPLRDAEKALRPLWVSWLLLLTLTGDQANHYFAHWPRLRVGAGILTLAAVAAAAQTLLLGQAERRYGVLSAMARRTGVAGLVFGSTLFLYVASSGGHLYTPDEWTIYAAAAGLVRHGVPAAFDGEPYPLHMLGTVPAAAARDGIPASGYSKYPILATLLAAPLYAIASLTGPWPDLPQQAFPYGNQALPLVPLLFNPPVGATTAALLYLVARRLGYGGRAALVTSAALAAGSLAWPYSKTLLNMPLAGALLLASYWCLLRAERRESRQIWWLAGAGLAIGLAAAARYEALLLAAPLVAYAAWRFRTLPGLMAFGAGTAVAIAPLVLGMNLLKTGSPFDAGYGGEGTVGWVSSTPWYGLFGILLSPGCGLLPHTPLMVLGLIGLIWLWEDAPAPSLAAGGVALLAVVYYGVGATTWCAHATWGPRYFVSVAPFMALPLAAVWSRLQRAGRNPFAWLVVGGAAGWSVATNLLAVLIDFNRGWQDHWAHGVTYLEVAWLPFFSGITSHFRLLREWLLDGLGGVDLYLVYAPLGGWWVIALLLALSLASATVAWEAAGRLGRHTSSAAETSSPTALSAAPALSDSGSYENVSSWSPAGTQTERKSPSSDGSTGTGRPSSRATQPG